MVLADGDLWFVSFVFGQNGGQDLIESLQQCSGKKILFTIFIILPVSLYITILLPTENGHISHRLQQKMTCRMPH